MKINVPDHLSNVNVTVTYVKDGDLCEKDISFTSTDKTKVCLLENAVKVVITAITPKEE